MAGSCPKGGDHDYRYAGESGGMVSHRCHKCGDVITRKQGRADRPGRAYVLALLAMLALCAAFIIWTGAPA